MDELLKRLQEQTAAFTKMSELFNELHCEIKVLKLDLISLYSATRIELERAQPALLSRIELHANEIRESSLISLDRSDPALSGRFGETASAFAPYLGDPGSTGEQS